MSADGSLRGRALRGSSALALVYALATGACAAGNGPVVFGVAGPFQTDYGASMKQGAELAANELNAAGGIGGRQLELREKDDQANPEQAIQVASDFLADPQVVAVVGHVNSSTTTAAGAVYAGGLPAVATSATSPVISTLGPWIFRVASSDSSNAVALAAYATRVSGGRTAVLYENDDYGRGLAGAFAAAFRAHGGAVLELDPYLETTEDLTPYLERLHREGLPLVFIAGLQDGAARIIEQARKVGLEARFIGGDGLEGLKTMGSAFDGTMVGLLYHPQESTEATKFAAAFQAAYGRPPDSFAALGYDAVRLLARAAAAAGPDRKAIRDYLAAVGRPGGSPPYLGAAGVIRFDQNGDPQGKQFAIGVIRGGAMQLAEGAQ